MNMIHHVGPDNHFCANRFFFCVVKGDTNLPLPHEASSWGALGEIEVDPKDITLSPGDAVIAVEAYNPTSSHYGVRVYSETSKDDARVCRRNVRPEYWDDLKRAGASEDIMQGAGQIADTVRLIHALRRGFNA